MNHLIPFLEHSISIQTKVVDVKNRPLKMYHGGSYSHGKFLGNAWFTTSKADARRYAKTMDGDVTTAYIVINKPLYTGNIAHLEMKITDEISTSVAYHRSGIVINDLGIITYIEANGGVLIAQDCGYDGVIDIEGQKIFDVVVWNPEQIIVT